MSKDTKKPEQVLAAFILTDLDMPTNTKFHKGGQAYQVSKTLINSAKIPVGEAEVVIPNHVFTAWDVATETIVRQWQTNPAAMSADDMAKHIQALMRSSGKSIYDMLGTERAGCKTQAEWIDTISTRFATQQANDLTEILRLVMSGKAGGNGTGVKAVGKSSMPKIREAIKKMVNENVDAFVDGAIAYPIGCHNVGTEKEPVTAFVDITAFVPAMVNTVEAISVKAILVALQREISTRISAYKQTQAQTVGGNEA